MRVYGYDRHLTRLLSRASDRDRHPSAGNADGIFVQTFSVTGTPENHPFNIHVQC